MMVEVWDGLLDDSMVDRQELHKVDETVEGMVVYLIASLVIQKGVKLVELLVDLQVGLFDLIYCIEGLPFGCSVRTERCRSIQTIGRMVELKVEEQVDWRFV